MSEEGGRSHGTHDVGHRGAHGWYAMWGLVLVAIEIAAGCLAVMFAVLWFVFAPWTLVVALPVAWLMWRWARRKIAEGVADDVRKGRLR